MNELIRHKGHIVKIENKTVWVQIEAASACSGCHAKGACGGMDCSQKEIEVPTDETFQLNEPVIVAIGKQLGFLALFLGYILPFCLLVGGIIVSSLYQLEEGICALIGLGLTACYYLALIPFRAAIRRQIKFTLTRIP